MSLIFDITNSESAFEFLKGFLHIDPERIMKFITSNPKDYYVSDFIEVNNINLKDLSINDVEMVVVHVTTNNDDCESIKKYGLLNLQQALTMNTPLKKHLKKNGIEFDIYNNIISLNSEFRELKYDTETDEEDMAEDRKRMNEVARKIYFDHQINGYFCVKNFRDYGGNVHERPEIINDIANLFRKGGQKFEDEWKINSREYLIKFKASIEYFIWYNFYSKKCYYEDDFESKEEIKHWLIDKALSVIWSYYYYGAVPTEITAYLKPEVYIPYCNIISIE